MTTKSDDAVRLVQIVEARLGLRIDLAAAMGVLDKRSMRGVLERIDTDPAALKAIAQELTVGETYFFRHNEQIEAFRDIALPARLAATSGVVRVLSAGCSSGEEPYTLAMVVRETQAAAADRVKITGIDLNEASIKKAQAGRYTRWSLRSVSAEQEKRWFTAEKAELVVVPAIKAAVTFTRANLTDPLALTPNTYDVVFCRNVLIYFSAAQLATTIQRLVHCLVPGGYLFLGHAESVRELPPGTSLCESHGTFYYRKGPPTSFVSPAPPVSTSWFTSIHDASDRVKDLAERARVEHVTFDVGTALATVRASLSQEDYVGALRALDALPHEHAHGAEASLLRAIALTESGDTARAVAACHALINAGTHVASAHYLLAVSAEGSGDLAGATRFASRATELEPTMAMAHLRLAMIARRRGELEQAREALQRAIDTLKTEPAERLALHTGGLGRDALLRLSRAELAAVESVTK